MGTDLELETERLRLRRWRPADREPFAVLNADPEVVSYLPGPLSAAQSDELIERIESDFERHRFGLWAVEVRASEDFVGFTGLARPLFEAHFTPAVEVGWRLARSAWGNGYATEAGRAALAFGFGRLGLGQIVALTAAGNERSRAVMERLGMSRDPADDFEHPRLPVGSPLRPHVLYRVGPPGS